MKLAVVMPAFDAAAQIESVLARLGALELPELERIVVVDDGSRDDTRERVRASGAGRVAKDIAPPRSAGAMPLIELYVRPRNGGYGAAMKDGLRIARAHGAECVACVHADGQYAPELLPALLATLGARELDLLQGSRIASGTALSGGMPKYKFLANAVLNRIENFTLGLGLSDYHSGYLVYGPRALASLPFESLSDSFDFDLEVIAAARARGLAIGEAPIPTRYADEISHLNPVSYGLRVLRVLWNYRRGRYAASTM